MRSQILAALLLLVAPTLSSPTPGGNDHKDDPKKDDCKKTVKPGQSIQAAINSAKSGDTILVEKGTYKEQLTITKSGITLIGKDATLLPPGKFKPNFCSGLANVGTEAGICIQGKDVKLAPFVQEHRKVESVGEYIRNVVVSGFTVQGFSGENIAVVGGKDVQVSRNKLFDGPQYGFLTVGSKSTLAEGNTVSASAGGFIAMCMDDKSDAKFKANDISGYYIALCTQTNGALVQDNKVKDSCIGAFVDPGINGAKVIGNTITDRGKLCPTFPAEGNAGAGIIIWGATNTLVEKNTIERITNNATGVGIFINDDPVTGAKAKGNVVKYNKLRFNDFDIFNNATQLNSNVLGDNKCDPAKSAPGNYCN